MLPVAPYHKPFLNTMTHLGVCSVTTLKERQVRIRAHLLFFLKPERKQTLKRFLSKETGPGAPLGSLPSAKMDLQGGGEKNGSPGKKRISRN